MAPAVRAPHHGTGPAGRGATREPVANSDGALDLGGAFPVVTGPSLDEPASEQRLTAPAQSL